MTPRLSYIAAPLSDDDFMVRAYRRIDARNFERHLRERGELCYNAIRQSGGMEDAADKDHWYAQGIEMLTHCDRMYVLMLDGWVKSVGIAMELECAEQHGIEIIAVDPDDYTETPWGKA